MPKLPKAGAHRARANIEESIAHGRQIRAWLDDRRVVVQTAVRASGVSAALEVDALGPVVMPGFGGSK